MAPKAPLRKNMRSNNFKPQFKPDSSEGSTSDFFIKRDTRRTTNTEGKESSEKKPFDKKLWRMKKYSKKYKLDQWENKHKRTVMCEYYKQVKDDSPGMDVQKIYQQDSDNEENDNENNLNSDINQSTETVMPTLEEPAIPEETDSKSRKRKFFKNAQKQYEHVKQEKQLKREEMLKKKAEREEALKEYQKKKAEKYKKLNRRTKKGQPIMKDRMEMLLEEIQSSIK